MTTVLQYLVIAAVIGLMVFGIVVFVFGRGEQMAPLSPRTSPTELPDAEMTAQDIRQVRFPMALRGYRMSDVDWALERMADEVDRLRSDRSRLSGDAARDGTDNGTEDATDNGLDNGTEDGIEEGTEGAAEVADRAAAPTADAPARDSAMDSGVRT